MAYSPGWVPEEEKRGLLEEADVVVFPSLYSEGFGIGPVEALKLNGVVVASDLFEETGAVTSEVVFVYPRESVEELTECLVKALSLTSDERTSRMHRAREWASRFSWERHVEELEKVFKGLLSQLQRKSSQHLRQ